MRKFLIALLLIVSLVPGMAQQVSDPEKNTALNLVRSNKAAIGITAEEMNETTVSNTYVDKSTGIRYVYLQQTYKGIPVYNQLQVLSFKAGKLLSKTGGRIQFIEKKVNSKSGVPSVTAQVALSAALADRKIKPGKSPAIKSSRDNNRKLVFDKTGISKLDITANLLWVPVTKGTQINLSWQVFVAPETSADGWLVSVDAADNSILDVKNYTNYDHWEKPATQLLESSEKALCNQLPQYVANTSPVKKITSPAAIPATASYRVIPFPAENPLAPGGTPALVTNPWLMVPGDATTLKWHTGLGGTTYNYTRGNNVWAYQDRVNIGIGGTIDKSVSSSTTGALTFDFTPDFTVDPTQTSPVPNQQFAITNLFYWNNIVHDVMYQYGFTEAAANFQDDNMGRGGEGNDHINAEAQDIGGLNNANFLTPPDGIPGRMQMYLYTPPLVPPTLTVNAPASIGGEYQVNSLSPLSILMNLGAVTGSLVHYNDDETGSTHLACNGIAANDLYGKIALIKRGDCTFAQKIVNAQLSGAIAVIIYNNVPGAFGIVQPNPNIRIPAVAISDTDGEKLLAKLEEGISVTLTAYPVSTMNRDSDLDNGIVVHEYGHGISKRLTGGGVSSCLFNAEQMGEGWSDYYGLMFTQDWANATLNTGFTGARAFGAYALNTPKGYRQRLYSTNFEINPGVYQAQLPVSPHDRGEIWCAALWDMTWAIIQQEGTINPDISNPAAGGGNTIAMKLVTEGMKLQPCSPGFIDGRNAIIQADINLYGGKHVCTIKEAFRKRGMGMLATQGSSENVNDQVPSFEEVPTLWVLDADGDGYYTGNPAPGCAMPAGWVIQTNQQPGDCDDKNENINPESEWYKDADDDGYGNGDMLTQCNRPPFYKLKSELSETFGDCNDLNPSVNPAAVEICRNGIDDNCNGLTDEENCEQCKNARDLTTIEVAANSATLVWSSITNADEWHIQYKTVKKGSKWIDLYVAGNKRSVTINALEADQNYAWRIQAKCDKRWTDFSTEVIFKTTGITSSVQAKMNEIVTTETFEVITAPNPSDSYFTLTVKSSNTTDRILVRVMDELGRVVEQKENVMSGTTIRFGDRYIPGMYFIMVQQGNNSKAVKLIRR